MILLALISMVILILYEIEVYGQVILLKNDYKGL